MEPTAETAQQIAKDWRNMIERRSNMLATDVNVLERHFISVITAAEARAEARGRTQGLEEAIKLACRYCSKSVPLEQGIHTLAPGMHFICTAKDIRALASRTGEGEADSADSGEEEKQSGGNG